MKYEHSLIFLQHMHRLPNMRCDYHFVSTATSSNHIMVHNITVRREDFEQNYKSHQRNVNRVKEVASEVRNIFCMNSSIKGYRIHQLGSNADSTIIYLRYANQQFKNFHKNHHRAAKTCISQLKWAILIGMSTTPNFIDQLAKFFSLRDTSNLNFSKLTCIDRKYQKMLRRNLTLQRILMYV